MREIRQSGSVRGVRRKPYPYRDPPLPMRSMDGFLDAGSDKNGRRNTGRVRGLPSLKIQRWATQVYWLCSLSIPGTWATRREQTLLLHRKNILMPKLKRSNRANSSD